MSQENRAETMAVKLAVYAQRAGAEPATIVAAYEKSVAHRLSVLSDVFHPDLLHPARTALILIDSECSDETVLAAGVLCETEYPEMRISARAIHDLFGAEVADLAAAVPLPAEADADLLEALVTAPRDVGLIAVAERLDHARHLHFRRPTLWPAFHRQMVEVYLPFSARVSDVLQRRLSRWAGAFEKRITAPE